MQSLTYIRRFNELGIADVPLVGGKNASLGEMYRTLSGQGVKVPNGFATTAQAYRDYLTHNKLETRIHEALEKLDMDDVDALAVTGAQIRGWMIDGELPPQLAEEITGRLCRTWPSSTAMSPTWRYAVPPPPRTCRTPRSPASRRPT